jgi:tetratricopeptide (TPR) repeat protein
LWQSKKTLEKLLMTKIITLLILISGIAVFLFGSPTIIDSYAAETKGDYTIALSIMQDILATDTSDPFYQIRVAWLLYLNEDYGKANEAYLKALKLKDSIDAQIGSINCQLALGKYSDALSQCVQQAKLHPENLILLQKGGYAAYVAKDYAKAADFFNRIADLYPWDMDNRGYLMNNLYLSGQISEAKKQYQFLKKYYPASQILITYKDVFEP